MEKSEIIQKEIIEKIESWNEILKKNELKSTKFKGAMTSEFIKRYLEEEGFNVSNRDSFIEGVPNEIDLMILKKDAKQIFNSYYKPEDVLAVFEIKYWGSYGKSTIESLRKMLAHVKRINPKIKRIYLTLAERIDSKNRIKTEDIQDINGKVFELFLVKNDIHASQKNGTLESEATGDWKKLIDYLKG